jgi:hypothetical protein
MNPEMIPAKRIPTSWRFVGELYTSDGKTYLGHMYKTAEGDYAIAVPKEFGRTGEVTSKSRDRFTGKQFKKLRDLRLSASRSVSQWTLIG